MVLPKTIQLTKENANVLRQTVLSPLPNEGCALLIGAPIQLTHSPVTVGLQIDLIWPCCNVWTQNQVDLSANFNHLASYKLTRKNRFQIDPKEQILAQKWARSRQLQVLGSAHSHPRSRAIPSDSDLRSLSSSTLMVIVDRDGLIRAWWISNDQKFEEIDVAFRITNRTTGNDSLN